MQAVRIVSSSLVNDHIHVVKELTDDEGNVTLNLHVFSTETVEWRMAEYNTDMDTAVAIILFEPFVEAAPQVYQDEHTNFEDTRLKFIDKIKEVKGKLSPPVVSLEAKTLAAKTSNFVDNVDDVDPLALIKEASFYSEETLDLKRQHVELTLELKRSLMDKITEQSSRADKLRSNLSKLTNK